MNIDYICLDCGYKFTGDRSKHYCGCCPKCSGRLASVNAASIVAAEDIGLDLSHVKDMTVIRYTDGSTKIF